MKRAFHLTLHNLPSDIDLEQVAFYICKAVENWKGGGDPDDEIFSIDFEPIVKFVDRGSPKAVCSSDG